MLRGASWLTTSFATGIDVRCKTRNRSMHMWSRSDGTFQKGGLARRLVCLFLFLFHGVRCVRCCLLLCLLYLPCTGPNRDASSPRSQCARHGKKSSAIAAAARLDCACFSACVPATVLFPFPTPHQPSCTRLRLRQVSRPNNGRSAHGRAQCVAQAAVHKHVVR